MRKSFGPATALAVSVWAGCAATSPEQLLAEKRHLAEGASQSVVILAVKWNRYWSRSTDQPVDRDLAPFHASLGEATGSDRSDTEHLRP